MMLRTTISTGTISSRFTSISRSLRPLDEVRRHALPSSKRKNISDMWLLRMPLSTIVPRFLALKAVASSLKYWISRSGSSVVA